MKPRVPHGMTRRHFVKRMAAASALAVPTAALTTSLQAGAADLQKRRRAAILLWMGGGASTIDMWDLKPDSPTGGPFRPIATTGEAQICEHLPMIARQMHHLSIVRSMSTRQVDHQRARYYMHTGYVPGHDVQHPGYGEVVAPQRIDHRPNIIQTPPFVTLRKTVDETTRQQMQAFRADEEPEYLRERYGKNSFGRGCLMARRLVEMGVPFIEVDYGGWDNHTNIFPTLQNDKLPTVDRAVSALVEDLHQRELLQDTAIIWMSEFSRAPRINQNAGRDHWARSWSVVVGGAAFVGGKVIGSTSSDGTRVETEPYSSEDLMASVCKALGISLQQTFTSRNGRPLPPANGGKLIQELFVA